MKIKARFVLPLLSILLLTASCGDLSLQKDLYGDWWPVHASGSRSNDVFSATWDGDLGIHGDIVVTFVNKNNSSLSFEDRLYYPMLSFSKKRKAYCTVNIESLGDMKAGRYLKFEVKDGKVFFEKTNDTGKGTGEFGEGQDLTFLQDDVVRIGKVTYERYAYFKSKHPEVFKPLAEKGFDLETPPIIFVYDD